MNVTPTELQYSGSQLWRDKSLLNRSMPRFREGRGTDIMVRNQVYSNCRLQYFSFSSINLLSFLAYLGSVDQQLYPWSDISASLLLNISSTESKLHSGRIHSGNNGVGLGIVMVGYSISHSLVFWLELCWSLWNSAAVQNSCAKCFTQSCVCYYLYYFVLYIVTWIRLKHLKLRVIYFSFNLPLRCGHLFLFCK
jgi:hypothetical protein